MGANYTYFGAVCTLFPAGDFGHDFSQGFDRLSFDARLGTATAHADWVVRLEDADGGAEHGNTSLPIVGLTHTGFQHFEFPLSSFTAGVQPVDLSLLKHIVFASANEPTGAGTVEVDLIIDNIRITGAQDISPVPDSLDFSTGEIGGPPRVGRLQLFNIGSRDLTVTGLEFDPPGEAFHLISPPSLPHTAVPFSELDLHVMFDPTGPGPSSADLVVTSDSPGETSLRIPLTGEVVPVGLAILGSE
jgi:hypothetical protein